MLLLLLLRCTTAHHCMEKATTTTTTTTTTLGFVYSSTRRTNLLLKNHRCRPADRTAFLSSSSSSTPPEEESALETNMKNDPDDTTTTLAPPWQLQERFSKRKRNNSTRFRQHVNPLARRFQQPTILSQEWPRDVFANCTKDLHVDIGCGKGGFLLDLVADTRARTSRANSLNDDDDDDDDDDYGALHYNYLGLEIRPGVAQFAKERIAIHKMTGVLEYLGCNANVDLRRILQRYHDNTVVVAENGSSSSSSSNTFTDSKLLKFVSIQYPDPHFKSQHAKRRVVTPSLIDALAEYMPPHGQVFLQSDVKSVLDDMRLRFRESDCYFQDTIESESEYLEDNPLGVPTEREISVLKKGLPVYRSMFLRNSVPYQPPDEEL